MNKDLSIVIPHYNSLETLVRLLDSIPDMDNIEVIVVDDYSENIDFELLKSRKSDFIFLKNSGKKSAGTCRNLGLKVASGKWILFADADDFFTKNLYRDTSKYFSDEQNDIILFVPISIFDDTGEIANRHERNEQLVLNYIKNSNLKSELHLRTKFVEPWSKLFRREFLITNNLTFDNTPISNDVFFSVSSGVSAKKILGDSNTIYCVTKNKGSITTIITPERYLIKFSVFLKQVTYLKKKYSSEKYNLLEIDGKAWLLGAILNKLGFRCSFYIFRELKKYKIPIINKNKVKISNFRAYIRFLWNEKRYRV